MKWPEIVKCYVNNSLAIENVFRVCIAWYKHERGWENSTVENFPNPSSVYIRLCKQRKKVFYCFYKVFLKINSTNEGKFCLLTSWSKIIFSIPALEIIFPTNQSKGPSDNAQTNEISRYKSQIKVQIFRNRQPASEHHVNETDICGRNA